MIRWLTVAIASAIFAAPLSSQVAEPVDRSLGIWSNPQNSVHVRSYHCGASMCGVVVWANDKAKADARRGGTETLIGFELFRDFSRDKNGNWGGKVFVPDIAKTVTGVITVVDPNTLKGSGCLIGRIGCKSQIWTRIE
jgi:uncharacterized protein (DUF2147 family)